MTVSDDTRDLNSVAIPEFLRSSAAAVGGALTKAATYGVSSVNDVTAAINSGLTAAGEIASDGIKIAGGGIWRGMTAVAGQADVSDEEIKAARVKVGPQPSAPVVYESLSALKPIQKLISEAGAAIGDRARTLASSDLPEIVGATVGVAAGGAGGAGILAASAASGTAGGAFLTSALAGAGGLIGGGMMSGIVVAAAPAVILSAAGVWAVGRYNKKKLIEAKEALLQEALRKRDVLARELKQRTRRTTNASIISIGWSSSCEQQ
jgi:hypothetical protein